MEVLFHTFYYSFGRAEENRSLYRGLRYIEVRQIKVPDCIERGLLKSIPSLPTQPMKGTLYHLRRNYGSVSREIYAR